MYLLASLRFLLYFVHLNFVSPASHVMPLDVVSVARKADVHVDERESQGDVLGETDVLYVMRVQKERFADEQEWEQVKGVSSEPRCSFAGKGACDRHAPASLAQRALG
jgi:aspartate carbamoyltransferase catalytic subunit